MSFRVMHRVRTSRTRRSAIVLGPVIALAFAAQALVAPVAGAAALNGQVLGWGANAYGEVGNGTTTNVLKGLPVVGLPYGVSLVAAGARHSMAMKSNGSVVAWGKNGVGELGNGGTTNSSTPVAVTGLGAGSGVVALSGNAPPLSATSLSGNGHSMALKSDGTVLGWGNNNSGQVGNFSTVDQLTPVGVFGLGSGSGVIAISAGGSHSLALKSDGTALAWGGNNSGQLGNGTLTGSVVPVQILGAGSGVVAISAGAAFSLALKSNGTVLSWGNNASGQLGNWTFTDSSVPVAVVGVSGVKQVAAGGAFSLALLTNGTVQSWGNNQSGQLGDGTAPTDHATAVTVFGATAIAEVSAGFSHGMARRATGVMKAWGRNASGELGLGTTLQHNTPVSVPATGVLRVSAGGSHTLILQGPVVTITPASGPAGTAVTLKGLHFAQGEAVAFLYATNLPSPASQTLCVATAGSTGTATCSATIPTSNQGPVGGHIVTGVGFTSGMTATRKYTLT